MKKENIEDVANFFDFKIKYNSEEYEKITQGYHRPEKGMDERWRFIFEEPNLYILRSWTNDVNYKLTFEQAGNNYIVSNALTYHKKSSNSIFWNNYHTKIVCLLIESYLLGEDLWFLLSCYVDETLKIDINGLHGFNHWKDVYKNGLALADKHGLDKEVIKYFAFLHDVGRKNEFTDIEHGKRSANLIKKMSNNIDLNTKQMKQLIEAVENHSDGRYKNNDETIMACLDADRLDLPRTGKKVDPAYLYFDI